MPDYGLRPPPYFSGELPVGILGHAPYGWEMGQKSNIADTPWNNYFSMGEFVYERLDWVKFKKQLYGGGGPGGNRGNAAGIYSNPPFMGAGQMTGPNGAPSWMRGPEGGVQRILRGYLRRQHVIATQPESFVRLYFMYNPDQVNRQYLSFTDDATADVTNQLGIDSSSSPIGSAQLTTLSFTLYFDRQIEVMTIDEHPGVLVDLQTFDVLSGNLIYTNSTTGQDVQVPVLPPGITLPDNTDATDNRAGQYQPMVSTVATTVTAVFSPSLAVEGVLAGASATFTKFSKRMTPTTMALNITLMVRYVGKDNNQSLGSDLGTGVSTNPAAYNPTVPGFVPPATQEARNNKTISGANAAVDYAEKYLLEDGATGWFSNTLRNQGPPCNNTQPTYTDAASLIWRSFYAVGWTGTNNGGDLLGLGGECGSEAPTSGDLINKVLARSTGDDRRWNLLMNEARDKNEDIGSPADHRGFFKELRRGDVIMRKAGFRDDSGHVAFIYGITGDLDKDSYFTDNCITILHSPSGDVDAKDGIAKHQQGGKLEEISPNTIWRYYNIVARPEPWGPTTDTYVSRSASGTGGNSGDSGSGANPVASGVLTYAQTVEAATGLALDMGTSSAAPDPIRLSPAALPAWNAWRAKWGGPIPCTSGWRDSVQQEAAYQKEKAAGPPPYIHAPAASSYHCKGLAVDIHTGWLNALSAADQSRLRIAAREAGWGQSRWRVKGQGQNAPYEAACNADKATDTKENWHFSVNGCG